MLASESITQFIEMAKARGASDETIVGLLKARGWPDKEAHTALGTYYEKLTGLEVPSRKGSGTAAKDAFFYLLIFLTLATWSLALGSLAFDLIDNWMRDYLFQQPWQIAASSSSIASELAAIFVTFPIFLLISRIVVQDTNEHPDKLNSPVRKWLTYLALVIAAGVFIGDLITILTYLLRGEITSRFFTKASVVLLLSGGVFFYYYGGMKKSDAATGDETWNRERWMAALSTIVVMVMIILGFLNIGAPKQQRRLRADALRMQGIFRLSQEISGKWSSSEHKLPPSLKEVNVLLTKDPETQQSYEYLPRDGQRFAICGDFDLDDSRFGPGVQTTIWAHPAGRHCFEFDAAKTAEPPPISYGYY